MGRNSSLARNPITIGGAIVAVVSFLVTVSFLIAQAISGSMNPLISMLSLIVLPSIMVGGLLMIPAGITITARFKRTPEAIKAGVAPSPYPSFDLNDLGHRRLALYFTFSTLIIGGTLMTATYKGFEFMDEPAFCGQLCHMVMKPEFAAHERSSHARVPCVNCHIGPGADWFVRSKLSGMKQVWDVATNAYPRPIESPIANLRPSRETCEQCHWPERFYGDRQRTTYTYLPDADNTLQKTTQLFRVGSGGGDRGGIHWHTTSVVRYYADDEKRQDIVWVGVESQNGTVTVYQMPGKEKEIADKRTAANTRQLDCIDCHNRTAHNFPQFDVLIDQYMRTGELETSIPFLKNKLLEAVSQQGNNYTPEAYKATLQRIEGVEDFYRTEYADLYHQNKDQIHNNIIKAEKLYEETVFPDMDLGPSTYVNELSHTGCFRCHGKLVRAGTDAKTSTTIPDRCDFCHYMPTTETAAKKQ